VNRVLSRCCTRAICDRIDYQSHPVGYIICEVYNIRAPLGGHASWPSNRCSTARLFLRPRSNFNRRARLIAVIGHNLVVLFLGNLVEFRGNRVVLGAAVVLADSDRAGGALDRECGTRFNLDAADGKRAERVPV
jgi:hypothetical protein